MYTLAGGCLLLLAGACAFRLDDARAGNFGIYGGTPINITDVPFMAIYRSGYWGCGASIVHEQFLVTAAHCTTHAFDRVTVGTDRVLIGGDDYEIEKVYPHPKYDENSLTTDYDIAVIQLRKKIKFNDRVKPIKMADPGVLPKPGDMLLTIGFGMTESRWPSNKLLSVKIPYVDLKKCQEEYKDNEGNQPTERFICAGGDAGKGSCYGDSGSPLVYEDTLIGLTSWGEACALKDLPAAYSYVSSMRDFIDDVIKNKA